MEYYQTVVQRAILFAHELGHNIGLSHQPNNHVNPRWIMRPTPGEGGGWYKFRDISAGKIKELFDDYWVTPQWGACVKEMNVDDRIESKTENVQLEAA